VSLRGQNNGGYICPIPAGYDDTLDLTVMLKLRRSGAQGNVDSIFRLINVARSRGLMIVTGGGSSTGGTSSDAFAICGSGVNANWGDSTNHNGRGMGAAGAISATAFDTVVVVVRGSTAADNSGSGGAQQIHEIWRNGSFGTVSNASGALALSTTGDRMNFLYRDGSTSVYFDGWIADFAVWQGWRPDSSDYQAILDGHDPRTLGPPPLVARSFRSSLTAEVGDTTMTAAGTAPTVDSGTNPPALVWPASAGGDAAHAHQGEAAALANPPASTVGADAAHVQHADAVELVGPYLVGGDAAHAHQGEANALVVTTRVLAPSEDAEIIDAAASTVTNATASNPTVRLVPNDQADVAGFVSWHCRVGGVAGKTPVFEVDYGGHQYGKPAGTNWRPVWQRPGDGPFTWYAFDTVAGATLVSFSNAAAFDVDTVVVAHKPVWREADYAGLFADLAGSAYAAELPSSVAAPALPTHVYAEISPGARSQLNTYKLGVSDGSEKCLMRCILLADPASQPTDGLPKMVWLLAMGAHANEYQGDFFMRRLARYVAFAATPLAQDVRRAFSFPVYNRNPLGRRYGKERWTEEADGDEDPNRVLNAATSIQQNAFKSALVLDVGSSVTGAFDGHGGTSQNTSTQYLGFFTGAGAANATFLARLSAKRSWHDKGQIAGGAPDWAGTMERWAITDLAARVSLTPELADGAPGYPNMDAEYDAIVEDLLEVMLEMRAAGELGAASAAADAAHAQQAEAGVLAAPPRPATGGDATHVQQAEAGALTAGIDTTAGGDTGHRHAAEVGQLAAPPGAGTGGDAVHAQAAGAGTLGQSSGQATAGGDAGHAHTTEGGQLAAATGTIGGADAGHVQQADAGVLDATTIMDPVLPPARRLRPPAGSRPRRLN
jgi:hypothetical protein